MMIDPGEGGEGGDIDVDVDVDDAGGDDGHGSDNSGGDDSDADPDGSDDDLTDDEEAEYQAKMAQLRSEKDGKPASKPKKKDDVEEDESEEGENGQQKEGLPKTEVKNDGEHTLKINGVEQKVSTDQLIQIAQKSQSADQRFQESASKIKQVENVISLLQTDPTKVFDKLKIDPEKVEQWLYDTHIAPQILEGDEKAQWERNREFESLKEREAEREEQDKQSRMEQTRQQWSSKIEGAIKGTPSIPQTDWSVNRVAQYMQRAIKGGFRDVTPEEVIPYVQKDWNKIKSSQMDGLDEDQMLEYIGESGAEKVRKALLKKHQTGQRKPNRKTAKKRASKKVMRSPYDML